MKKLFVCLSLLALVACKSSSSGSVSPIQQAGCDIETAITSTFAGSVASALSCTNQTQIQTDLQNAFGNANLCVGPVASVTSAQIQAAKAKMKNMAVSQFGPVANVACPIAVSAAMGFLSNVIPSAWGCTASASASTLVQTLTTLCEVAVPI